MSDHDVEVVFSRRSSVVLLLYTGLFAVNVVIWIDLWFVILCGVLLGARMGLFYLRTRGRRVFKASIGILFVTDLAMVWTEFNAQYVLSLVSHFIFPTRLFLGVLEIADWAEPYIQVSVVFIFLANEFVLAFEFENVAKSIFEAVLYTLFVYFLPENKPVIMLDTLKPNEAKTKVQSEAWSIYSKPDAVPQHICTSSEMLTKLEEDVEHFAENLDIKETKLLAARIYNMRMVIEKLVQKVTGIQPAENFYLRNRRGSSAEGVEGWLEDTVTAYETRRSINRQTIKRRRAVFFAVGQLSPAVIHDVPSMPKVVEIPENHEANKHLQYILDWGQFHVFAFANDLQHAALPLLVDHIFKMRNVYSYINIARPRLTSFLHSLSETYSQPKAGGANRFHNHIHAMDVVQSLFYCVSTGLEFKNLTMKDLFAAIIAAAVHDYAHPARTNQFLVKNRHKIALVHNDQSVLERHHLSSCFMMMSTDSYNFLQPLPESVKLDIRQTIIDLVLATDVAESKVYIEKFHKFLIDNVQDVTKVAVKKWRGKKVFNPEPTDLLPALLMAIKVADVSNACKPLKHHLNWVSRILDEFFDQGDEQNSIGMKTEILFQRDHDVNSSQVAFHLYLSRPLIIPFAEFFKLTDLIENANANLSFWMSRKKNNDQSPYLINS